MAAKLHKKSNLFIVFEGINGAGKSTAISSAVQFLKERGSRVLVTKEPGSPHTKLGELISNIVKGGSAGKITPEAEALLFAADRVEHVKSVVMPAIARGEFVVCDRFVYSSITFQGHARGLGREIIEKVNRMATDSITPDIVFLFDLPVETALARMNQRSASESAERDIFEDENIKFHQRIREGYLELAKENPDNFIIIDATQDRESINQEVIKQIDNRLA